MTKSLSPRKYASDPLFGQNGLIDRMFDLSFPFKMLKAFDKNDASTSFLPACDISSDDTSYTIHAELAGIPKDSVKLEIHDRILTLSGEKKEEIKEGSSKHVVERRYGSFERTLTLPDDADCEKISASQKDGVLTITIPKTEPKVSKKAIEIK